MTNHTLAFTCTNCGNTLTTTHEDTHLTADHDCLQEARVATVSPDELTCAPGVEVRLE